MEHVKCKLGFFHSLRKAGMLLLMLILGLTTAFAQQATIKGKVLDETGEAVTGVTVLEKGTVNGVITDVDGNYTISVVNAQKAVLQFSFIGYTTKDEPVNGRKTVDISLEPSVVNLGEVVVVGYGTQTRREITGSIININEANFRKGVTTSAADLLQGKIAGLNITTGSGSVGNDPTIRLRGVSTLQNDQGPFIVIDGVPGGSLSQVAPQDIESISVLKDASSAAIYGSRSAGGVILITTKRGSGSKATVAYNGYLAASTIANKPRMFTASEWRNYANQNGFDTTPYDVYGATTDWFGEISRTGFSQNHNVSISGGTAKSNYRASFNYLKDEGVLRDDALERYNFRFQFQQRAINDRLRISLTGSGILTGRDEPNTGNIVLAYNMLPVYPVKLSDGSWYDTREYDQGNPVRNQDYNQNNHQETLFFGNGELAFDITSDLNLRVSLYKERHTEDQSIYHDSSTQQGRDDSGYGQRVNQRWDKNLMEWLLEYKKTLGADGKHKINAMLGYSWEGDGWTQAKVGNRNFVTDMLGANSLQSGQGLRPNDVESERNMSRLISIFGRANYSYQERYMLTATVRRDGSTKFGANHKWGLFPSASAAWGISQESFMKDIPWIEDLKLRVGYGITGNQSGLDPYKTLELYGTNNTYYDGGVWKTAYQISQNPNPNLKWESTAMLNVGLDFTLFKGKLSGTVEWYDKKTSDMLYSYPVPTPPYMYSNMMANVGDMDNKGIELALTWNVIRSRAFNWTTTLTLDHNANKITRLSNDLYTTSRIYVGDAWIRGSSNTPTSVVEVGRPVGQFYGWKFLGFDSSGHYILQDTNNDGQISDDDRTYIGSPWPIFTYGWTNTFNYKNFDLSFFFRGTYGNKVLNHARMAYAQPGYLIGANALNDPLVYQLKEVPKYCSLYIEDGSFIRLDNLSLGYTFNTKKIGWLDQARVYVTGQNLFVLSKFKGPDPEVDMARNDGLAPGILDREFIPKAHTYSFGVSFNF